MADIHPTAIVAAGAELAEDVVIRAYCVIGPEVSIGSGSVVGPHVVIDGNTRIGSGNTICPFSTIGYPPQDVSYRGEDTRVVIGNNNLLRENVTIHRGTARGRGVTTIGDENYLMAYSHVAHDCFLGSHIVIANATNLAGHVVMEDHVNLGGLVAIHQFVRIGTHAFISGKAGVGMDVAPYMLAFGAPAKLYGPNTVGLRRAGFSSEAIRALKNSYKIVFRSGLPLEEALARVESEVPSLPEVDRFVQFIKNRSKRGIAR